MSVQSQMEVQPGMEVFTADAVLIGTVKNIEDGKFLVDRKNARDIYVPVSFVTHVLPEERRVEIGVTEDEFDAHDWEQPDLF